MISLQKLLLFPIREKKFHNMEVGLNRKRKNISMKRANTGGIRIRKPKSLNLDWTDTIAFPLVCCQNIVEDSIKSESFKV